MILLLDIFSLKLPGSIILKSLTWPNCSEDRNQRLACFIAQRHNAEIVLAAHRNLLSKGSVRVKHDAVSIASVS